MLTLDQFVRRNLAGEDLVNQQVKEPGFRHLYVKWDQYLIDGRFVGPLLCLSNIRAMRLGKGAFTQLIARLRRDYPAQSIYVQCVINPRFRGKLEALGFSKVVQGQPSAVVEMNPNYFWDAGVPAKLAAGARSR